MFLISALASIGLLAAVASASAAIAPPVVNESTLTVSANGDDDTIVLASTGTLISVNGAPTTLAANANAQIVVNAGGGDDTVDATALGVASYRKITINGGDGNDLLTGGANADLINGDAGEDRLLGFTGTDEVNGGDGDDLMVWNNKDSSDSNEGGAGVDEVEVNGAPNAADAFTVRPSVFAPATVRLERKNLVPFTIDLNAERLTINGLGGGDGFNPDPAAQTGIAGLTAVSFNGGGANDVFIGTNGADQANGGGGNDSLFGVDGNDQITGGDGNDTLEGEGGDDRLVGGPGTDTMFGDEGDDALVWNNGDGSDPENKGGSGFDRVEVNGSPTAGDAFALEAGESGATFKRTNLVPFVLTIAPDAEQVAVNGGGGDDVLGVQQTGSRVQVLADGGAGKDQLNGGNEADSFFGGSGDDALMGAGGSDLLDGGEGADRLLARDKTGDLVRGGAGSDSAQTDEVTLDAIEGVEVLDATPAAAAVPPQAVPPQADGGGPAPDKIAPVAGLGKVSVVRSHGNLVARVSVTCPAIEAGGCRTALTLTTAKAVARGQVHKKVVLGSKTIALGSGQSKTVTITLAGITAKLANRGSLATRIRVASSDATGNSTARSQAISLRIPRH